MGRHSLRSASRSSQALRKHVPQSLSQQFERVIGSECGGVSVDPVKDCDVAEVAADLFGLDPFVALDFFNLGRHEGLFFVAGKSHILGK